MTTRSIAAASPRASFTGAVYLSYFLTAVTGQMLAGRKALVLGEALNVISFALYIALALLFYFLFKPVNRPISLLAAIVSLAGSVLGLLGLFHRAPAYISPLVFFAPYCLLIGYLIVRSTFLPHLLGWLMLLAGVGWLAYLSPPVAHHLSVPIEVGGFLAEAALMLWLLIKGVNVACWEKQSNIALRP